MLRASLLIVVVSCQTSAVSAQEATSDSGNGASHEQHAVPVKPRYYPWGAGPGGEGVGEKKRQDPRGWGSPAS